VPGDAQKIQARVLGRDQDLLGEAARPDPGLLEDLAEGVVAAPTPVAHKARDVVMDDHAGAQRDLVPCGERLADRDHLTHGLVPQHDGRLPRHIPVQQVAAAHAAREHPHQHLAWAGRGQGALLDPHVTRCVTNARLHDCELNHTTAGSTRPGRQAAGCHAIGPQAVPTIEGPG
jgi:hypothetical protein